MVRSVAGPVVCLEAVGVMTGVAIRPHVVRRMVYEAGGVIVGGVALVAYLLPVRCHRVTCGLAGLCRKRRGVAGGSAWECGMRPHEV